MSTVTERPGAGSLELMTVGESMIVLVPEGGESLEHARHASLHAGGAESNVAHYLAQLGHRVGWASRLGDDPFGHRLLSEFSSTGIDVSFVSVAPGERTGIYFKDPLAPSVYYYRSSSAASAMEFSELLPAVTAASRLHVSGITAALNTRSSRLVRDLVTAARERGIRVSFDVNYRPALWASHVAGPVLADLAALADIAFVGLDEAQTVWGIEGAADVPDLFAPCPEVVVKDGAVGATVFLASGETVFEPSPTVDVVEPVGAGDAFAAGYLSAAMRQSEPAARLRWGHLLAAQALIGHSDYATLPAADVLERHANADADVWAALRF